MWGEMHMQGILDEPDRYQMYVALDWQSLGEASYSIGHCQRRVVLDLQL